MQKSAKAVYLLLAGSASVYDLIKKELLALKVETSTLSMSMKKVAPQASLQEVVKKHAETEAKLTFVMDTLLMLEARMDVVALAQNSEHSSYRRQLQVCCHAEQFNVWYM